VSPLAFDLLGEPVRLADPGQLWLLAAVAALAALGAWRLRRRGAALREVAGPLAPRVAPAAGGAGPAARLGLWLAALALLAVALARPQCGSRTELARRSGIDLVIALDVSRSMLAQDVVPDRLGRARLELAALLARSAGDRVGLVVFARNPVAACPLTRDTAAVATLLRAARPEAVPDQGTDLGAALRAARDLLASAEQGARSKVVLLVTDGEDQAGGAAAAARELAEVGIRVHVLAVGGSAGAPIPLTDASGAVTGYKRDRRGQPVTTRCDDGVLAQVAARGNGEVFDVARPERGTQALRASLDGLARTELAGRMVVVWEDRFAWLTFPALLALLGALLLREARAASPEGRGPPPPRQPEVR
jgi:Ca-activated chloride channel homolog